MVLGWILLATFAAGVLSVLAAAIVALVITPRHMNALISYSVGVLLGAALLDLVPHAAMTLPLNPLRSILASVLAGIGACFIAEKLVNLHQSRAHRDAEHVGPSGLMMLMGGGLHNFTDGILLAAAFMTDLRLGLIATLAIVVHEIPREMGEFGVLLGAGFGRRRALLWNVVFSLAAIAGGLVGYFALSSARPAIPFVVGIAAGSFLYIALADLVPGLHEPKHARSGIVQAGWILAGVTSMALVVRFLH